VATATINVRIQDGADINASATPDATISVAIGAPGPSEVTTATATDLTGYLKGDGDNVSAVAPAAMLSTILTDSDVTALGTSGAVAVDASAHAVYDVTPTGNITLTITNDSRGSAVTIRVNASAFTITWSITGLKWVGGAAPTLPTTAGRSMLISLKRFGTNDWIGIASEEAY